MLCVCSYATNAACAPARISGSKGDLLLVTVPDMAPAIEDPGLVNPVSKEVVYQLQIALPMVIFNVLQVRLLSYIAHLHFHLLILPF